MRTAIGFPTLLLLLAGCTQFTPPDGYIRDPNDTLYDYKAVSARGHVIAMKQRANEDKAATLRFWTDAIEHQKVDIDGMKLAARDAIKGASGMEGVLFRFEIGEGQAKITYLLAVYVNPSNITTIEATGPASDIEKEIPAIRKCIEAFNG